MAVEGSPQVGMQFPPVTAVLLPDSCRPNFLTIDSGLRLSQKSWWAGGGEPGILGSWEPWLVIELTAVVCPSWFLWLRNRLFVVRMSGWQSLPTSKLYNRPVYPRRGVEVRNVTLFGKTTDQEDGRLMSQNNHLIQVWMPGSFIEQRWRWAGGEKSKWKGH